VRKHLSSELGFSKADRDLNIRRIAYVAGEITRHGGIAICAPIAPYASVRREARSTMTSPIHSARIVHLDHDDANRLMAPILRRTSALQPR